MTNGLQVKRLKRKARVQNITTVINMQAIEILQRYIYKYTQGAMYEKNRQDTYF